MSAIWFALGSNISFAAASTIYAEYSRKVSPFWMNFHKALVAWLCFLLAAFVLQVFTPIQNGTLLALLVSGLIGLCIGDLFLLKGFAELGAGRTLMLFGFQPFILGLVDLVVFRQALPLQMILGVVFLVGCVFVFSLESLRLHGHWGLIGLANAILGILLDAGGLVLTRWSFQGDSELSPFYANFIRTFGALAGFGILALLPKYRGSFFKPFFALPNRERWIVSIGSAVGTFISLSFYLHAVQIGPLAMVSAIAGTSPLVASLFECLRGRRPLTWQLFVGSALFIAGFACMMLRA